MTFIFSQYIQKRKKREKMSSHNSTHNIQPRWMLMLFMLMIFISSTHIHPRSRRVFGLRNLLLLCMLARPRDFFSLFVPRIPCELSLFLLFLPCDWNQRRRDRGFSFSLVGEGKEKFSINFPRLILQENCDLSSFSFVEGFTHRRGKKISQKLEKKEEMFKCFLKKS